MHFADHTGIGFTVSVTEKSARGTKDLFCSPTRGFFLSMSRLHRKTASKSVDTTVAADVAQVARGRWSPLQWPQNQRPQAALGGGQPQGSSVAGAHTTLRVLSREGAASGSHARGEGAV